MRARLGLASKHSTQLTAVVIRRDYRRMETLDRYDASMLDTRQYDDIDADTRRMVEEELDRRDAREGRVAQVFQEDQEMELDDAHRRRLRRAGERRDDDSDDDNDDRLGNYGTDDLNLEHFDVPLREWIATERPRNEIKRRFVRLELVMVISRCRR